MNSETQTLCDRSEEDMTPQFRKVNSEQLQVRTANYMIILESYSSPI